MGKATLRLRVDAPYPGESMSVLPRSRRAVLWHHDTGMLGELLRPEDWDWCEREGRREMDLKPPPALDLALAQAVQGWLSPLYDHNGFEHWTLAPRRRDAYCPLCFEDDLRTQRTPYFRMDWIPVLVTQCWRHRTPLFQWESATMAGWRPLPKAWVHGSDMTLAVAPEFMQRHISILEQLRDPSMDPAVTDALSCLWALQETAEKQSITPAFARNDFGSSLRSAVQQVTLLGARHLRREKAPPIASLAKLPRVDHLFESAPRWMHRRSCEQSEDGLRQTDCLAWRRTYLLFTAMTLQRSRAFGHLFPKPTGQHQTWKAWWQAAVHYRLGEDGKDSLAFGKRQICRYLDA